MFTCSGRITPLGSWDVRCQADALAFTFAQQVAPVKKQGPLVPIGGDYYPGGDGWMVG